MRIENAGVLRSNRLSDALLHFENLRTRLDQRCFEAADLASDFRSLDRMANDLVQILPDDVNAPAGNARRHAHALKADFFLRVISHPSGRVMRI